MPQGGNQQNLSLRGQCRVKADCSRKVTHGTGGEADAIIKEKNIYNRALELVSLSCPQSVAAGGRKTMTSAPGL